VTRNLVSAIVLFCSVIQLSCSSVDASGPSNTGSPSIKASSYPTLQAAIDAIPLTGGTLVIDGQFEATATTTCSTISGELGPCIYNRTNIRLLGDGVTSKIYTTGSSTTALQIVASDLVVVSGIEFAGPWTNGMPADTAVAVRADVHLTKPSTRVTVEHCRVHNFPFDGLWARNGTSQIHFLHNESYDNQWNAIEIEAQDSSVIDNDLHDNGGQGIEIYSAAQRLRVQGNRANRDLVGIKLINDPTFGVLSFISVVGNEASQNKSTGILYQATSSGDSLAGSITITGNTTVENLFDGIAVQFAASGLAITDNISSSNTSSDVDISHASDIVIANNVLTALPGSPRAINGIYLDPTSVRIHISNNATDGF
jgi:hypothetical protein